MFSNKHVVVALLVAPLLAVLAWFAVGYWFGERPQPAVPGGSYPLLEKSNCRYSSGECSLENGSLQLTMTARASNAGTRVELVSATSLAGAAVGVRGQSGASPPVVMQSIDTAGYRWAADRLSVVPGEDRLLIVVQSQGSRWYGEAQTAFMRPDVPER